MPNRKSSSLFYIRVWWAPGVIVCKIRRQRFTSSQTGFTWFFLSLYWKMHDFIFSFSCTGFFTNVNKFGREFFSLGLSRPMANSWNEHFFDWQHRKGFIRHFLTGPCNESRDFPTLHSTFSRENGRTRIVLDPWMRGNGTHLVNLRYTDWKEALFIFRNSPTIYSLENERAHHEKMSFTNIDEYPAAMTNEYFFIKLCKIII